MVGITESLVYAWFDRAAIEYRDLYMRIYVAYNAWYQKITGASNDHEAIALLTKRFVIWDEYQRGASMSELRSVVIRIVMHTQNTPLRTRTPHWDGVVKDSNDWVGLIHYWYEVRCGLFHGAAYAEYGNREVQLAYESLYLFMQEIVARMKTSFHESDKRRLEELRVLTRHDQQWQQAYIKESILLHQKFISAPELWNVDMHRRLL